VEHAVADRLDDAHVLYDADLGIDQGSHYQLDGDLVVGALVVLDIVGLALRLMRDGGAADGDALHDAGGEYVFGVPIVDLIFYGGGSAIEGEYDHGVLLRKRRV
jgi:hypothetical protein